MSSFRKNQALMLPLRRRLPKERFFELDFARGVLMVLLLLYHLVYTLGSTYQFFHFTGSGPEPAWVASSTTFWYEFFFSEPLLIFQLLASSSFFFLCGVSCGFSRHNAKRGYALLLLGMIETILLETMNVYFGLEAYVYIGLLHALGISIMFYALIDHFFPSLWVDLGVGIALSLLFAIFYNHGILYDIEGIPINPVHYVYPEDATKHLGEVFLGFATAGDDSWSPIRTSAFVFLGAACSKAVYKKRIGLWRPKSTAWAMPITYLGRHSLVFYLAEQFIVLAIMWCVLAPFGYTF